MNIDEFNELSESKAQRLLIHCVQIDSWGKALVDARPYISAAQLYQYAQTLSQNWQWSAVAKALNNHPRIGERQAAQHLTQKEQAFSQAEQGQLSLDNEIATALYQGNVDYEQKFGHIFLIRAAGRDASEILAQLQRRLGNTAIAEQREVITQLGEIALLRLQQEVRA